MTDLKDVTVTQVALGKVNVVALTNKGHIYTFGINNKGQCGRDYVSGASKEGLYYIPHVMVLTNKGHIYTFYIDNKGQCGRDYVSGASKEGL